MPDVVVERVGDALNERGKSVRSSRAMILGVSCMRGVGDIRGGRAGGRGALRPRALSRAAC